MIWRVDLITHGGLSIRRQSTVEGDVANSQRRERRRKRMSRVLRACGSGTTISRQTTTITRNRISFYTQRRIHLAVRPLLSHSDVVVFTNRLLVFSISTFFLILTQQMQQIVHIPHPSIDPSFFFSFSHGSSIDRQMASLFWIRKMSSKIEKWSKESKEQHKDERTWRWKNSLRDARRVGGWNSAFGHGNNIRVNGDSSAESRRRRRRKKEKVVILFLLCCCEERRRRDLFLHVGARPLCVCVSFMFRANGWWTGGRVDESSW